MSNFEAIAGVSRTLRTLLLDRMETRAPKVTIAPPDVQISGVSGKRVNLFLYDVSENGSLKNQEIPGQGHPAAYGHPPLSLDLHYLLTAYGSSETAQDADLEAQQILGDAMRVFHDFTILTEELSQEKAPGPPPPKPPILDYSLLGTFERIKITLQPLSLEDLSKIWTAMPQTNFRRSVAYQVSVVQIESERLRCVPRPVKRRRIHVSVVKRPEITDVYRTPSANEPQGDKRLAVGQELTIEGHNFWASRTWVRLGGLDPIGVQPVSDTEIRIHVPDDQYPADPDHPAVRPIKEEDRLQPGAQLVEVLIQREADVIEGGLDRGTTSTVQSRQGSNHAFFMLVPSVTNINPTSGGDAGTMLTVTGSRLYREDLKSYVVAGDVPVEVRKPGAGDPWSVPSDTSVQVALDALSVVPVSRRPLDLVVSSQVNGAQSTEEDQVYRLT
jgi:hypothetical protein